MKRRKGQFATSPLCSLVECVCVGVEWSVGHQAGQKENSSGTDLRSPWSFFLYPMDISLHQIMGPCLFTHSLIHSLLHNHTQPLLDTFLCPTPSATFLPLIITH